MNAPWLVAMDWIDTLFLHWPADADALRALIPRDVQLDVMEGSAWIGIVAFSIAGARARVVPPRLALRTFGEVNVRTYVTGGGKPGVWFLSLDAASRATVAAGRALMHLPYYDAKITTACVRDSYAYRLERTAARAVPARFAAQARIEDSVRTAAPGSLEHALVERYCFFTTDRRGRTVRGDVVHPPWPLHDANATILESSLFTAAGVTPHAVAPLAHASPGVSARAWYLAAI